MFTLAHVELYKPAENRMPPTGVRAISVNCLNPWENEGNLMIPLFTNHEKTMPSPESYSRTPFTPSPIPPPRDRDRHMPLWLKLCLFSSAVWLLHHARKVLKPDTTHAGFSRLQMMKMGWQKWCMCFWVSRTSNGCTSSPIIKELEEFGDTSFVPS